MLFLRKFIRPFGWNLWTRNPKPCWRRDQGKQIGGTGVATIACSLAQPSGRTTVLSLCFLLLVFEGSIIIVLNVAIRDLKQKKAWGRHRQERREVKRTRNVLIWGNIFCCKAIRCKAPIGQNGVRSSCKCVPAVELYVWQQGGQDGEGHLRCWSPRSHETKVIINPCLCLCLCGWGFQKTPTTKICTVLTAQQQGLHKTKSSGCFWRCQNHNKIVLTCCCFWFKEQGYVIDPLIFFLYRAYLT